MEFAGDSLDAILIELYEQLLNSPNKNDGSRGPTVELLAVSLRITKPRARLSRSENRGKPFSALGELLWYLSKSDELEFIKPYVPEYEKDAIDGKLPGAYGPRLFLMRSRIDQIENVTRLLRDRPGSRRAVIQLFNAEDIVKRYSEIPCTTTMQFHIRDGKLYLSVTMRSNDAFWGLPHDVFCFTMLQEMMARRLNVQLGEYYHFAGSMHAYDEFKTLMKAYIEEGHHRTIEMPEMPNGDPFTIVPELLVAEQNIRRGSVISAEDVTPSAYWADIIRLIQVFWARSDSTRLNELIAEFTDPIYKAYLAGLRYRLMQTLANNQN